MTSKAVNNERVKLLAGFANTIATTFLSAGCIGPALAFFYGLAPAGMGIGVIVIGAVICVVMSAAVHCVGQLVLGGIRE